MMMMMMMMMIDADPVAWFVRLQWIAVLRQRCGLSLVSSWNDPPWRSERTKIFSKSLNSQYFFSGGSRIFFTGTVTGNPSERSERALRGSGLTGD